MIIPANIDTTVLIKLDPEGKPSTDPTDVVKFTQQLLMKAILVKTQNGSQIPDDITDMITLVREMNATALTTRKLNQEEASIGNQVAIVEAYNDYVEMIEKYQNANPQRIVERDPYANLSPPEIDINPLELSQGEQPLNPDDYL